MHALIDGDLLPYEFGGLKVKDDSPHHFWGAKLKTGDPVPFEMCWAALQNRIDSILQAVGATSYKIYLSSSEIKTWRYEAATILPYKGNREGSEKPVHFQNLRTNMINVYDCDVVEFMEADDAISIAQHEAVRKRGVMDSHTVICTRDKDLKMIPGWHYSWPTGRSPEKPLWQQTSTEGLKCFYKQLLTGDKVDNILGLYGVGAKSTHCKAIDGFEDELTMLNYVWDRYRERFGSYAEKFLKENGQLLWMLTESDEKWCPVELKQKLEEEYGRV